MNSDIRKVVMNGYIKNNGDTLEIVCLELFNTGGIKF